MTVSLAAKLSLAASFFLTSSISGEAALPKHVPSSQALMRETIIRPITRAKPKTALDYACEDPALAANDGQFYYLKSENDASAYKMTVAYFEDNYDEQTKEITYSLNTDRVLCPV